MSVVLKLKSRKVRKIRFKIRVRFEVRRSQSILAVANPMKILISLAASNPDIEMRRAASTGWTVILIDEEFPQIWTIENLAFGNGGATRVCSDC